MYSLVEENYLKSLFNLSLHSGNVNLNELSSDLGLKMPTVNSMIKKMAQKNLLIYEKYKPIELTDLGKKEASLIIRKHRLTEMFLVEVMGFGWEEVHEIAEQIEHIKAPLFFQKMDKMLGNPKMDPHGSPIPDVHGNIVFDNFVALSSCLKGDKFKLKSVLHGSKSFLEFLNHKEIELNTVFEVLKVESFDGSVEVEFKGKKEVLSIKVAANLLGVKQ